MDEREVAIIHGRVGEVIDRLARRDNDGVVSLAGRFAREFAAFSDEPWMVAANASVAVTEAVALRRLDRVQEALQAFARLRERFGHSPDPFVRDHVARGMMNRAQILASLERRPEALAAYDEVIAVYGEDPYPLIGRRVAWAIWNQRPLLEALGRDGELSALHERMADRRVEGVEAALDHSIAWCLQERARRAWEAGAVVDQSAVVDEIVERFGASRFTTVRRIVLDALLNRAATLTSPSEIEALLATYDEIVDRFGDATQDDLVDGVAEALRRRAYALDVTGRADEALECFDAALARVADAQTPALIDRRASILISKGLRLGITGAQAEAEAVVVFDGAVAACVDAVAASRTRAGVVHLVNAIAYKVDALCRLRRSDEADAALAQLVRALGDVVEPSDGRRREATVTAEAELAGALADVLVAGECWAVLDPPRSDAPSREMADRALELYRVTESWLSFADPEPLAAMAAVGILRDIADGYALLSETWSDREFSSLPLPRRAQPERDALCRRFGLDEWLTEHGHGPLAPDGDDVDEDPWAARGDLDEPDLRHFAAMCASALHLYGLRLAICDSAIGRRALDDRELRYRDLRLLANARMWAGRLGPQHPLTPAGGMCVMIAQSLFVSSHSSATSSAELLPSRDMLRELFDGEDGDLRRRLHDEGVVLPAWLGSDTDPG